MTRNEGWGDSLALAVLGDIDADGALDLGYADPFQGLGDGTLNVLFGGADLGTRTQIVPPERPDGLFGTYFTAAGDLDGDGYDDVLIAAPNVTVTLPGARAAALHLGEAGAFAATAAWTTAAWTGSILPDLDGDGDAEVAVCTLDGGGVRALTVYAGTPLGPGGPLHAFTEDAYGAGCLESPRAADFDGDGQRLRRYRHGFPGHRPRRLRRRRRRRRRSGHRARCRRRRRQSRRRRLWRRVRYRRRPETPFDRAADWARNPAATRA